MIVSAEVLFCAIMYEDYLSIKAIVFDSEIVRV